MTELIEGQESWNKIAVALGYTKGKFISRSETFGFCVQQFCTN